MVRRRTLLGGATVAAVAATPIVASALASRAHAATALPLTVVNNTGAYANSAIRMYIVGVNPAGQQGYVRTSGVFTPCSPADNGPDGFADLSVPLVGAGNTTITLPNMSGRVYFAIGAPLRFRVVTDGAGRPALQYPAGWVASDPSYNVLHDCMEFTFNGAGMFCNTTSVDMFSIPMSIQLLGNATQSTGALVTGGRDRIFAAVAAQPDFARLVVGNRLRVIAPGHGIDAGLFSRTYFDGYIGEVWTRYATTDLRVNANARTFVGRVSGGNLVFSGVAPIRRPTTRDVFFCDGALAAPNDGVTGPVAAVLGAGFNRSTLRDHPTQPTTDPATFYRTPVTNHYSRVLHENATNGKAYGFAFDDVVDFASYLQDLAPRAITVTLTPFGSAPNPGPTTPPPTTPPPGGGRDAYARIEAESFNEQAGTQTEACSEGGSNVGWVGNGDWLRFTGVNFGATPARQFSVRVASGAAAGVSGLVEVRLDSRTAAPAGSLAVGNTGGWQSWRTVAGNLAAVTGVHDLYLTFASGQPADYVNVNWLTFAR
jgi:hypothetical protein